MDEIFSNELAIDKEFKSAMVFFGKWCHIFYLENSRNNHMLTILSVEPPTIAQPEILIDFQNMNQAIYRKTFPF